MRACIVISCAAGSAVVLLSSLSRWRWLSAATTVRARANDSPRRIRRGMIVNDPFPSLNDSVEMAALSLLAYSFRNIPQDSPICDLINTRNFTQLIEFEKESPSLDKERAYPVPPIVPDDFVASDLKCHYYHHERVNTGTQVMIVSSALLNYVAVAFAGTDDIRTSLTDANVFTKPFGQDDIQLPLANESLNIRIHGGFNNALFSVDTYDDGANTDDQWDPPQAATRVSNSTIYDNILWHLNKARSLNPSITRLFTTGHSLGAANSVLTAVALTIQQEQARQPSFESSWLSWHWPWEKKKHRPSNGNKTDSNVVLTSINFGCPQIGNKDWRDYLHDGYRFQSKFGLWRFVLGWDIIPRLPSFMYHTGHTAQLHHDNATWWPNAQLQSGLGDERVDSVSAPYYPAGMNATVQAFYQHYGNATLHYASVPYGWSATPYIWVPGALLSHHIYRYWAVLYEWKHEGDNDTKHRREWLSHFVKESTPGSDDDHLLPNVDDDFWVNPPDGKDAVLLRGDLQKTER
jgi:Lipase (class 3)